MRSDACVKVRVVGVQVHRLGTDNDNGVAVTCERLERVEKYAARCDIEWIQFDGTTHLGQVSRLLRANPAVAIRVCRSSTQGAPRLPQGAGHSQIADPGRAGCIPRG